VVGAVKMEAGPLSIEYEETGGPLVLVGVTVPYTMTDVPSKVMSVTTLMIGRGSIPLKVKTAVDPVPFVPCEVKLWSEADPMRLHGPE
jgi:hypothetical protein